MPASVAILACLALLAAGCASATGRGAGPVHIPDGIVIAFADGFHSGVILPRAAAPPELMPADDGRPWVAFHFGERGFITGAAAGTADALRLGLAGGAGGMQVDALSWWVHDRGGTDPARVRIWIFPLSTAELAGVRARLRDWVAPAAVPSRLRSGTLWWPTIRRWSLFDNCHDFTIDVLAGGGIEVAAGGVVVAGGLRAALDQAWAAQAAP